MAPEASIEVEAQCGVNEIDLDFIKDLDEISKFCRDSSPPDPLGVTFCKSIGEDSSSPEPLSVTFCRSIGQNSSSREELNDAICKTISDASRPGVTKTITGVTASTSRWFRFSTQRTPFSKTSSTISPNTPVLRSEQEFEEDLEKKSPTCVDLIDAFLNTSITWAVFVCVLTVWALFIDDIRILCMPKSADLPVLIINLCILAIFFLEFVLCWFVQDGYAWSLGASMDFLAAVSLIPLQEILHEIGSISNSISVARVARAARALRILRATRAAIMALKTQNRVRRLRAHLRDRKESILADTLIQRTNIKMLLGILVLLIGTSVLDDCDSDRSAEAGIDLLDRIYGQRFLPSPTAVNRSQEWLRLWHDYRRTVEGIDDDSLRKLMRLKVWDVTYLHLDIDDIRERDIDKHFSGGSRSVAYVSKEDMSKRQAIDSLAMTVFSVAVIMLWAWSFRRDHHRLVIQPVMRMIKVLQEMALDPRQAIAKAEQKAEDQMGGTEMDAIEDCIRKFGGLLKVGFGEAGVGIIQRNLRNLAQENFDPVVPGVIVKAVFGFCDIRNFTDCCEVLNEDTMIFTNRIAHVVHTLVEDSGGTVNKNIGDAFLAVWKLKEEEGKPARDCSFQHMDTSGRRRLAHYTSERSGRSHASQSTLRSMRNSEAVMRSSTYVKEKRSLVDYLTGAGAVCDAALESFVEMNEQMRNSEQIQQLSADPRLQKKVPGYRVRLGSGLHLGWAIEGAVGSSHKVDATYLSPHVNMAATLESATKHYGVSILISEAIAREFTEQTFSHCRPIDKVTVKGSVKPLILYVHMPSEAPELGDEQYVRFMHLWDEAFVFYQSGLDWEKAVNLIEQCLEILPRDVPGKVLLEFIKDEGGAAPLNWPGYRELSV